MRKAFLIVLLAICCFRSEAAEKLKTKSCTKVTKTYINNNKKIPKKVEMVVNLSDGRILHKYNHNQYFHPASLTKLMTVKLAFDSIKNGKMNLDTLLKVPGYATVVPRSKIYLKTGEYISLRDALKATIISSANDAATTICHNIVGSRDKISKVMNSEAYKIGMVNTKFVNPSGLHHPEQKTTAKDMLRLAKHIRDNHKDLYHMFSEHSYEYNGKTYHGHNNVTKNYIGAEGLKTGYISQSGFNLVTIAKRKNVTLLALVAGGKTAKERDNRMMSLLDKCFESLGVKI